MTEKTGYISRMRWTLGSLLLLSLMMAFLPLMGERIASGEKLETVHFVDGVIISTEGFVFVDIAYVGTWTDRFDALEEVGAVSIEGYDLIGFAQPINPVPYHYNPTGAPVSTAIVEAGVEGWNGLGGPIANIIDPISPLRPGICENVGGDGQYTVGWGEVPGLAIGIACWNQNYECDQKYDNTYQTSAAVWQTVALHEMGHCWGLGHEFDVPEAVMAPSVGSSLKPLHQDDKDGFCAIYACLSETPTPTLSPTSTATATRTNTPTNTATPSPTRTLTPTATVPPGPPPGDADCDGDIDPVDALIVLKVIAGLLQPGCHNAIVIGVTRGVFHQ